MFAELQPEEIKPPLKNTHANKTKDWVFPEPLLHLLLLLLLLLHRRCRPSVSAAERLDAGAQSYCLGAQMHTQSHLCRRLNSVNPSAVPNLRTQAAPLFSPLSRIFTLSHGTSSQHKFHWKPSSLSAPTPPPSPPRFPSSLSDEMRPCFLPRIKRGFLTSLKERKKGHSVGAEILL